MEPLFSWLHLSDIHFGHAPDAEQNYGQRRIVGAVLADLKQLVPKYVPKPRAIFVTGDIAFSGGKLNKFNQPEYDAASQWLNQVQNTFNVDRNRVFIVPGNHDVVRADAKSAEPWLASLLEGKESLASFTGEDEKWSVLRERLARYLKFADAQANGICGASLDWALQFDAKPLRIRVVGWNTAMLANGEDRGKLDLDPRALELLAAPDPDELVFLLSHHPLSGGWLKNETHLVNEIGGKVHLHLSGHVHEARTHQHSSEAGSRVDVQAGAVHLDAIDPEIVKKLEQEIPPEHCYSLGAIYAEDGKTFARIFPRRWHETANSFRWDVRVLKDHAFNIDHELPVKVSVPSAYDPGNDIAPVAMDKIPWASLFAGKKEVSIWSMSGFSFLTESKRTAVTDFLDAKGLLHAVVLDPNGRFFDQAYFPSSADHQAQIKTFWHDAKKLGEQYPGQVTVQFVDARLKYTLCRFDHHVLFLPHPVDQTSNKANEMVALIFDNRTTKGKLLWEFFKRDVSRFAPSTLPDKPSDP